MEIDEQVMQEGPRIQNVSGWGYRSQDFGTRVLRLVYRSSATSPPALRKISRKTVKALCLSFAGSFIYLFFLLVSATFLFALLVLAFSHMIVFVVTWQHLVTFLDALSWL